MGLLPRSSQCWTKPLAHRMLLHVIDAGDPGFEAQREVTDKVLAEIGADSVPRIRVFNKIHYLHDAVAQEERAAELQAKYPGCIVLSARCKDDITQLHQAIVTVFQQELVESEIILPWSAQGLRGEIFASCDVLEERADAEGAFFRFRAAPDVVARLNELLNKA